LRDLERCLAEHVLDQLELTRGQLRRDHRKAGALWLGGSDRRERGRFRGPLLDQR
jgi:hypothetical protein